MRTQIICLFTLATACRSDKGVTVFNSPPQAVIISHADGDIVTAGSTLILEGALSDPSPNHDPSELEAQWKVGSDILCDYQLADENGFTLCETVMGTEDMTVRLIVRDPEGATAFDQRLLISEEAVNGVPSQPTVTITPDPATALDTLLATASGSVDAEGPVTYDYAWTDGASTISGPVVDASDTTKGQVWTVTVTPYDTDNQAGPIGTATITIGNLPPSQAGITLSPQPALDPMIYTALWMDLPPTQTVIP